MGKSGDTVNWKPAKADRERAAGRKGRGLPGTVGGVSPTVIHSPASYFNIGCFTFSSMINFKHIQR